MTCNQNTTHFKGCDCHEARRDAEVEALKTERDSAWANVHQAHQAYQDKRIAELRRLLAVALEAIKSLEGQMIEYPIAMKLTDAIEQIEGVAK